VELRTSHLVGAVAGAAVLHLGLVALFHEPHSSGAQQAGRGGVQVGLAAGGAAGEAVAAPAPATVRPVDAPTAEASAPDPETVQAARPETAEAAVAELTPVGDHVPAARVVSPDSPTPALEAPRANEPRPVTATPAPPESAGTVSAAETVSTPALSLVQAARSEADTAAARPAEISAPTPQAATARPPQASVEVAARTASPAPPAPRRKPPPPEAALEERPPPRSDPPPEPESRTVEAAPRSDAAASARTLPERQADTGEDNAMRSGTQGRTGSADAAAAGDAATGASGGGTPGVRQDYLAALQAWLNRHKEYPRRARLRRQEGTALLYFAIDRQGRVLDYGLRRGSGHKALDRAVIDMIERAAPLPEMPAGMARARLEVTVPVRFALR